MDQQTKRPLESRLEAGKALVIAGVQGRYSKATVGDIPRLWELFDTCIKDIKKRVGGVTYGVCHNPHHGEFDYLAGVEVPAKKDVPSNFEVIEIPPLNYAVFPTTGRCRRLSKPTSASCSNGCRIRATRSWVRISSAIARTSMPGRARGRWKSGCRSGSGADTAPDVT